MNISRWVVAGLLLAGFSTFAAGVYFKGPREYLLSRWPHAPVPVPSPAAPEPAERPATVRLSGSQLAAIKITRAQLREFPSERQAIGSIDFNEDMTVQVMSPYPGRILDIFAKIGDEVKKGNPLFTIDSPDLVQADSSLIAAAGVLELATQNLARMKALVSSQAVSRHDYDQAVSDQQAAEGVYKAARDAVLIFGKTEEEVDKIVATRKVDPVLTIPVPVTGRVTARNAAPGLFVQPSSSPAPFTVADVTSMWMLASIPEAQIPHFKIGQDVKVRVLAYPDREFEAKITALGATVDPTTHRVSVRSEVADPQNLLRPGMFASFVIQIGAPMKTIAIPVAGVVREGDGSMSAWIKRDNNVFERREVTIGAERDGFVEIREGIADGDAVAAEGALYLSNALAIKSTQ